MPTLDPPRPFRIAPEFHDPFRKTFFQLLGKPLEHALGLSELNDHYAAAESDRFPNDFLPRVLASLKIETTLSDDDLARVPAAGSGPFLVVSNHPFGGLDGIILLDLIRRVRPDAKVMANFLLARVPEFHDSMIFVDPFHGKDAPRHNLAALRASITHLQQGHPLIIFPAGEVSHIDLHSRTIIDPQWSDTVAPHRPPHPRSCVAGLFPWQQFRPLQPPGPHPSLPSHRAVAAGTAQQAAFERTRRDRLPHTHPEACHLHNR